MNDIQYPHRVSVRYEVSGTALPAGTLASAGGDLVTIVGG